MIDFSTEFGRHVAERIRNEKLIWFVTMGKDGTPQPRPIWFIWENDSFLFYSQPQAAKLRHITRNPKVALNFEAGSDGEDVVVFIGEAYVDPTAPSPITNQAYLTKYREGIKEIGMTEAEYEVTFSTPVRVKPIRLRGLDPI